SGLESYRLARRFLDGLRFKIEEGTFDHRDYRADSPLGYQTLVEEWLSRKEKKLTLESFRPLKLYAHKYAVPVWGNRNVKTIGFKEIEKFLVEDLQHLSSKSRANARSALHDFFQWLVDREDIEKMPKFPTIDVVMEMRSLLDKDTQLRVLEKLRELTWEINPRIWISVKWLSTYFSIRPKEMLSLKEKNVDLKRQVFVVPPLHDKTGRGKVIPMLVEDVELAHSLPRSLDQELPFFRHIPLKPTRWTTTHMKRMVPGTQFRHDFLAAWWGRACAAVGVSGVSLYPGTKHTSVSALCEEFTPEQIKTSSRISTNEAFSRYFQPNPKMVKSVYGAARGDGKVTDILSHRRPVSRRD
ncbi:MAG: site-specific integrase, partial [Desulfobacteraceae bacterium]|nr:site-specific integrase [Desulfobacteraceae bacterium]